MSTTNKDNSSVTTTSIASNAVLPWEKEYIWRTTEGVFPGCQGWLFKWQAQCHTGWRWQMETQFVATKTTFGGGLLKLSSPVRTKMIYSAKFQRTRVWQMQMFHLETLIDMLLMLQVSHRQLDLRFLIWTFQHRRTPTYQPWPNPDLTSMTALPTATPQPVRKQRVYPCRDRRAPDYFGTWLCFTGNVTHYYFIFLLFQFWCITLKGRGAVISSYIYMLAYLWFWVCVYKL